MELAAFECYNAVLRMSTATPRLSLRAFDSTTRFNKLAFSIINMPNNGGEPLINHVKWIPRVGVPLEIRGVLLNLHEKLFYFTSLITNRNCKQQARLYQANKHQNNFINRCQWQRQRNEFTSGWMEQIVLFLCDWFRVV